MIDKVTHHVRRAFPAFGYKNYRIFFAAQLVSLTGTWMETVSEGYLAFQMTHSPLWVGIIAGLGNLPTTLLALVGGTLVDRYPKRNILRFTQSFQMVTATTLGIIVLSGHITLPILGVMVFLMGLVNAVDQPARISLPIDLVERRHLHSATALNMSIYNSARIIGPAIAGLLIFSVGTGWAFLLNGLSFIAPVIAFNLIDFAPFIEKPHLGTWPSIKEGLHYAFTHKMIRFLFFYMAMIGIFGWSYTTMLPVIAANIFHKDASGLGLLFSAAGAGTVLGAITVSAYSRRFNPYKLILFGGLVYSIALFLFTLHSIYLLALGMLFIVGFGQAYQNSTLQATIQRHVDDNFRGRVSSIQALMMQGMQPIGSFQVGLVATYMGPQFAVAVGAIVIFIAAILLYLKTPKES